MPTVKPDTLLSKFVNESATLASCAYMHNRCYSYVPLAKGIISESGPCRNIRRLSHALSRL